MIGHADFAGQWRLSRRITDTFGNQSGTLEGQARFITESDNRLVYEEEGQLRLGTAAPMQATRRYIWHFEGAHVRVTFANGDPFHSFLPIGTSMGTTHLCGPDTYNVRYQFADWPRWQSHWDVSGPAKAYVMLSDYSRP